ncbi:hypothetical protein FHT17_002700 [Novosphingobium sp. SG916]|nr:hypothetical protein [Novosphingobium sp. SG720]NMN05840.1 hypothetical protein [Novosphingobium sp. SG919]NMN87800.1 hypothetical protein [Novosphingobium sp. SG916]
MTDAVTGAVIRAGWPVTEILRKEAALTRLP